MTAPKRKDAEGLIFVSHKPCDKNRVNMPTDPLC